MLHYVVIDAWYFTNFLFIDRIVKVLNEKEDVTGSQHDHSNLTFVYLKSLVIYNIN